MVNSLEEAKEIFRYRELLRNLVFRDIKVRYKRSFLGFVWVMLNPLLMMLIMNIVFSEVFKISTKNYTAYLLSGIILWNFFAQSTSTAVISMVGNSNLIKEDIHAESDISPLSRVISHYKLCFFACPSFYHFSYYGHRGEPPSVSTAAYLYPCWTVFLWYRSHALDINRIFS